MLSHRVLSAIYQEPHRAEGSSWWGDLPEPAPHSAWHTLSGPQDCPLPVFSVHVAAPPLSPVLDPQYFLKLECLGPLPLPFGPHSTSILSPGGLSQALTTMSSFCTLKPVSYAHLNTPLGLLKLKYHFVPFSPSNIQTKTTEISAPPIVFSVSIDDTSIFLSAQVKKTRVLFALIFL